MDEVPLCVGVKRTLSQVDMRLGMLLERRRSDLTVLLRYYSQA